MSGIERDEFQNFRQDVSDHFKTLHECDRRIEGKIDGLIGRIEPALAEHRERAKIKKHRRELKLLALGAALGALFSSATSTIISLFKLG